MSIAQENVIRKHFEEELAPFMVKYSDFQIEEQIGEGIHVVAYTCFC